MSAPALALNAWLRYDLIQQHLEQMGAVSSILEIGPGQGAVGARLAELAHYVGVEQDQHSRAAAGSRLPAGAELYDDFDEIDPTRRFGLICAFEVLEHIDDDEAALHDWTAWGEPGGWLLLSVPANPERFGAWDERVGHLRRYDRDQLRRLVERVGYRDVVVEHCGFPLGYGLETARNLIARRQPGAGDVSSRTSSSGRQLQPGDRLAWTTRWASAPFRLAQRPFRDSPLGTGLVLSARRAAPT